MGEVVPMILKCLTCNHRWPWTPALPMQVNAFVARIYGECFCPKCGGHSRRKGKGVVILTGAAYQEAASEMGITLLVEDSQ